MPPRTCCRATASVLSLLAVACASGSATTTTASVPAMASVPAVAVEGPTILLTRLGIDTVAVEQYTRTATHMEGVIVAHSPFTNIQRYSVEIGADGLPVSARYAFTHGDGTPVAGQIQPLDVYFGADTLLLLGHRALADTTRKVVAHGQLLPTLGSSYALYEIAVAKVRASGRDSAEFAGVPLAFGVRVTNSLPVKVLSHDSARITWFGFPLFVRFDKGGTILGVDGSRTTIKVSVDPVATVDLDALAKAWMAREKAAGAFGTASTRDTVRARVANAQLWVDYGRPALRGRDVWVNGVLGDTIWRTGANAATQLHTDKAITIGGAPIPPGTYSLWTHATTSGYRLIINRQSGQWGTEYNAERDLARVPLRETTVATPVERFTTAITPQGLLTFVWGSKQLSVPIVAK